jgi:uncharacterized phage protein (TIGR01671 family)
MREHKYRAWHKQEQKMYLVAGMIKDMVLLLSDDGDMVTSIHMDEVDLMDYTGRKDRKGDEVYDGDILGNKWGKYRIYWDTDSFIARSEDGFRFHISDIEFNALEIIGNIYEHSHILEDKSCI